MMSWHFVTSAQYKAGTPIDGDMYFLKDTHEIYRGTDLYTESVLFYTTLPTTPAQNRLYINSTTLEGKMYDGTSWNTVIKPVSDTVVEDDGNPVSGKAVAAYVAAEMSKVSSSGQTVHTLSWDSAEHILTITKGDDSTETITFDGLGVSLNYVAATGKLQLLDASGNAIGDAINLDLERFVSSGEYDDESRSIILYFDAEKTDSVTIPVGDLVDTYEAEGDGKALELTVEGHTVKGSIKISTAEGNAITADENGLYVTTPDVSGKMDKVTDATSGNIAVFGDDGQVVDSGKNFDDIASNVNLYEGSTLDEAITGKTPVKNDIAVVSEPIGSTGKVQKTVYQYNGESWVAFDAFYDASKIILPENWDTTTKIGVIQTLTNGKATIAEAGTSVLQALKNMTLKETNPKITQPAVTFASASANIFKAYEVGTNVELSNITANLSAGTYEFGYMDSDGNIKSSTSAGVSATKWTFTDTEGVSKSDGTTNKATFDSIEVNDSTSYKITATAEYGDSPYTPITNTGKAYEDGKILAGSKSATTRAITGYRNCFYGSLTHKNELTSDIIRSLTKTNAAVAAGTTFDVTVKAGALRTVVAYEASATSSDILASVIDVKAMQTDIKTAFNLIQVDVEGANGYEAKAYKVFYIDYADACEEDKTYTVTL